MINKFLVIPGLVMLILTVHQTSSAQQVTAGVYHNPPMTITNSGSEPDGYFVEILNYIGDKAEWELTYYTGTWEDCLSALKSGKIDLIVDVAYSPERNKIFDFNEKNISLNGEQVYLKPDSEVESIYELEGKTIAGLRDDVYFIKFTNTLLQQEIDYNALITESYEEVMRLVESGTVEAGVVNVIFGMVNDDEYSDLNTIPIPITDNPVELRFATLKGQNTELLNEIDKYFTYLKQADFEYYRELNHEWLTPYVKNAIPTAVKWIIIFVGVLIVFFTFNYFLMKSQVKKKTLELVVKNEELIQEIHEHNIARENLQKKDELLQGVAKALNILLTEREHSLAIKKALNSLAESADVDRVYIFEFGTDELSGKRIYSQRYGFISQKGSRKTAEPEVATELFDDLFPTWYQILSEGKIISGPVRKFNIPGKQQLLDLDVQSVLIIPIIIDSELHGFIAFDDCKQERYWDESEKSILFAAATSIGGAISRNQIEQRILKMNEELEQRVFERTAQLMAANDELEILNEVIKQVSTSLDFDSVFDKIAEFLKSIYNFEGCAFAKIDEEASLIVVEKTTADPEFIDSWGVFQGAKVPLSKEGGILAECVLDQRTKFYNSDHPSHSSIHNFEIEFLNQYNAKAVLLVPIIVSNEVIGVFCLTTHSKLVNYSKEDLESIQRFTNQLALVIKNSMLYDETEKTKNKLEQTLDELRKAQKQIVIQEKMASLGELTAGIAHEIKNPLNFVNNFAALTGDMVEELKEDILTQMGKMEKELLEDIYDLLDNIETNVQKINQHGKRADSIVQGMLLHSRGGQALKQSTDINRMIQEDLNLAYHGLRAKDPSFNVNLEQELDDEIPPIQAITQDISRVFINIITNGCYAVNQKKKSTQQEDYHPTIKVITRNLKDRVEIRIHDNGTGIPSEIKEKIFAPFFTTKPSGEGTGLGLSISYEIIVQEHNGTIDINTQQGEFTEFIITFPKSE